MANDPYKLSMQDRIAAMLAGAGSGAVTGASIGSILPGVGTVAGGVVGGLAGVAGGVLQNKSNQDAMDLAKERDEELEKKIGDVDNMAKIFAGLNAQTAGAKREGQIGAQQAASRAGLGEAAAFDLGERAGLQADMARLQATGSAVQAAGQADIAEKQRIISEEANRQALFDDATQFEDVLGALGGISASAAYLATLETGESADEDGALFERVYGNKKVDSGEVDLSTDGMIERNATSGVSAGFDGDELDMALNEMFVGDTYRRASQSESFKEAVMMADQNNVQITQEVIGKDLATGAITEDEINMIAELAPEALTDPVMYRNMINTIRASSKTLQAPERYIPADPSTLSEFEMNSLVRALIS